MGKGSYRVLPLHIPTTYVSVEEEKKGIKLSWV